jgi:hypothetical protein
MWRQNLFQITQISPKEALLESDKVSVQSYFSSAKRKLKIYCRRHYLRGFAFISYILTYRAPSLTKKDKPI